VAKLVLDSKAEDNPAADNPFRWAAARCRADNQAARAAASQADNRDSQRLAECNQKVANPRSRSPNPVRLLRSAKSGP
jgi:hypothetical protein